MYGTSVAKGCMHGHFKHSLQANSRTQSDSLRALVKRYWATYNQPCWSIPQSLGHKWLHSTQNVAHSQWNVLTSKAEYENGMENTSLIFYVNSLLSPPCNTQYFWWVAPLEEGFWALFYSLLVTIITNNKFIIKQKTIKITYCNTHINTTYPDFQQWE